MSHFCFEHYCFEFGIQVLLLWGINFTKIWETNEGASDCQHLDKSQIGCCQSHLLILKIGNTYTWNSFVCQDHCIFVSNHSLTVQLDWYLQVLNDFGAFTHKVTQVVPCALFVIIGKLVSSISLSRPNTLFAIKLSWILIYLESSSVTTPRVNSHFLVNQIWIPAKVWDSLWLVCLELFVVKRGTKGLSISSLKKKTFVETRV